MALPHINNSTAGVNKYDAVFANMFEVYFSIPDALKTQFQGDEAVLTEHVTKIEGLDQWNKAPEATITQTFMGSTRTFLSPKLDDTSAEFSITLSLNLRNSTDNYIYKLMRAWSKLGYDIETGTRNLKTNYCSDWVKVSIANQEGVVYRQIIFKDVIMSGAVEGMGSADYTDDAAQEITVKFKSDWGTEINI